ncbi:MAG TPA: hypothetical protein VNH44_14700 [Micropepsaceae bacterium]|nr:hypothetical protein [Micropepsaceae bacterium]
MRAFLLAAAGLALLACAVDPSVYAQANLDCQAVGITEKDPQFAVCSEAYSRRHLEDQIAKSYHGATQRVPTDVERRMPHQDAD